MMQQRFAPEGLLAISPRAFGGLFPVREESAAIDQRDGVAIVQVRGPLMHHANWCFDSYESIAARVAEALKAAPKAIVLSVDSPGGVVAGCFETSRQLRAMCQAAKVPLVAYVDGQATSAAYALACAADRVVAPPTGLIGSIGILETLVDATQQAQMFGLSYTLVSSGARKVDGNPATATSPEAVAETQRRVDSLAEMFFALVAEMRGVSADDVRALEAGVVHGGEAKNRGLIDEVATLDTLLASLAGGTPSIAGVNEDTTMTEDEKARAALQAILDDEESDEKAKARARRALAAMDEQDEPEAEGEETDKPEDESEEPTAASTATAPEALAPEALASSIDAAVAKALAVRDEQVERAKLIASRPDLDAGTVALLETAPIAQVRTYVASAPRRVFQPAAAANVQPTLGEGQGDPQASRLPPEQKAALDARMGLHGTALAVVNDGRNQLFGVPGPAKKA